MLLSRTYYTFKILIPRPLQIWCRRYYVKRKRFLHAETWPIDPNAGKPPEGWSGWPDGKKFALVLTHDVDKAKGLDKCYQLAEIEERLGFRSSFNLVSGDYEVPAELRRHLTDRGFEIGVHGLHHDNNPFRCESVFRKQSVVINRTLKEWGAVGFRSPSMYHDLEMLHHLDIEYDASTFDTDPFEPQPDGMGTIFPFWVPNQDPQKGYVELPYTLPQDFLIFVLMEEKNIDIWKKKLDWIVDHGGMALLNVHPNYINFDKKMHYEEFSVKFYEEFLEYIKSEYKGKYWQVLPRDVARFWANKYCLKTSMPHVPCPTPPIPLPSPITLSTTIHACMLVYGFYETDTRVRRYAESLAKRGDTVDVIALIQEGTTRYEKIKGVNVYRIQKRKIDEKGKISYLLKLIAFFLSSSIFLTYRHLKDPYQLIHVHSVPDFEVFATFLPKLQGAKIILDIHDIVPEFYASKFNQSQKSFLFKLLVIIERLSIKFSDHVIIANHLWQKTILSRSAEAHKCTAIMNYPDELIFFKRQKERNDAKFIMIYPGTLGWHQGLDIAIKAFAMVKEQDLEMEFHIYGRGAEKKNLENLIVELGLKNRVFMKERVSVEQIASIMANADLAIVPKRNDPFGGEAFSTKILEFMFLGVPVIASATKIDKFYFNDSLLKFFNPDDANDLAQCMLLMRRDKALRNRLRENAKRFVESYSWEKRKHEYLELVDSLTIDKEGSNKR